MEIIIRENSGYKDVTVDINGTSINLGLHDDRERIILAQQFIQAAQELMDGLEDD